MTYSIGTANIEMFVWKLENTAMTVAILLLTPSMPEIETLDRKIDKNDLICAC